MNAKRILLAGVDYYPLSTPGSFRLHAFARHLGEFGYEPHILALDWGPTNVDGVYWSADCLDPEPPADPCPVTRFYYRFPGGGRLRRALRQYTVRGLFPISWPLPLTRLFADHMERLHAQHPWDMILATVPYGAPMAAAHYLHKRTGLPWGIDFRDVRGQWPMPKPWTKPWRWLYPAYERWAVSCQSRLARRANAVVTVSEPLAKMLARQKVTKVSVVHNGFAPEEFSAVGVRASKVFRMIYAGTLVPEWQDPAPVLEALDLLCRSGKIAAERFSLDFYGTSAERIRNLTTGRRCAPFVHARARLSKRAIHEVMAEAGILLHLSTPGVKGILTSKLTEYLGARRPILTVAGDGDVVDRFLVRTRAGVSLRNPSEIAGWIFKHYEHWKSHGEYIVPDLMEQEVEKYTWRRQVEKLAGLLDTVQAGGGHALGHGSHTPVQ